jgi:hypothetical protein
MKTYIPSHVVNLLTFERANDNKSSLQLIACLVTECFKIHLCCPLEWNTGIILSENQNKDKSSFLSLPTELISLANGYRTESGK